MASSSLGSQSNMKYADHMEWSTSDVEPSIYWKIVRCWKSTQISNPIFSALRLIIP